MGNPISAHEKPHVKPQGASDENASNASGQRQNRRSDNRSPDQSVGSTSDQGLSALIHGIGAAGKQRTLSHGGHENEGYEEAKVFHLPINDTATARAPQASRLLNASNSRHPRQEHPV
jgi:hypothetical protein